LVAAATATVLLAPWIAFNLHAYHALSGAKPQAALVEPVLGKVPHTLAGARQLWNLAVVSSFIAQINVPAALSSHYRHGWAILGALFVAAGALVSAALRRWDELAAEVWLGISVPLGLAAIIAATMIESGAGSSVVGRHLAVLLPAGCLAVAFGVVAVFGSRLGAAVILILLAVASFAETGSQQAFVRVWYTQARVGNAVPIIDQSYNDGTPMTAVALGVRSPCPATRLSLAFAEPPPRITINHDSIAPAETAGVWTTYLLPSQQSVTFIVAFPRRTSLYVHRQTSDRRLFLLEPGAEKAVPVARIFCDVPDAGSVRFRALYSPQHPFPITYQGLLDWPEFERAVSLLAAVIAVAALALDAVRRHRATPSRDRAARRPPLP
jgi:hypothetical protein